jgi:hypothetical protein
MQALPHCPPVSPRWRSQRNRSATVLLRVSGMIHGIRFADTSPNPRTQADEPKSSEPLVTKPKATFQWPPDCLWPFIDQEVDGDT